MFLSTDLLTIEKIDDIRDGGFLIPRRSSDGPEEVAMPCAVLVHGITRRGQQASELGGAEEALSEAEGQCLSPVVQRCCTQGSNSVLVGGVGITQYDAVAPLLQPFKAVLLLHRQARVPHRGRVLKPCPDVPLVQGEHRGHCESKLSGPIKNENHSVCPF